MTEVRDLALAIASQVFAGVLSPTQHLDLHVTSLPLR